MAESGRPRGPVAICNAGIQGAWSHGAPLLDAVRSYPTLPLSFLHKSTGSQSHLEFVHRLRPGGRWRIVGDLSKNQPRGQWSLRRRNTTTGRYCSPARFCGSQYLELMRLFGCRELGSKGGLMSSSLRASEWPSTKTTIPLLRWRRLSTPSKPLLVLCLRTMQAFGQYMLEL